jgi:hypothetical protein
MCKLFVTFNHLVPRPFRIALGTTGCMIFFIAPISGILLIMALASHTTVLFSIAVNLVGILLYYFYHGSFSNTYCKYSRLQQIEATNEEEEGHDAKGEVSMVNLIS